MTPETRQKLKYRARQIRRGILTSTYCARSGHPGGSLSSADLLAYLYSGALNVDPAHPEDPDRDRFVLSKGHVTPAYYSALAMAGFIPEEELKTFRAVGSRLQGHPNMNLVPGVDMSTGSLGLRAWRWGRSGPETPSQSTPCWGTASWRKDRSGRR